MPHRDRESVRFSEQNESKSATRRRRRRPERLRVESLEGRCLLNASLDDGFLQIHGDEADNTIDVALNTAGDSVEVTIDDGEPQEFELAKVEKIGIQGRDGDDTITVDP